MRGSHNPLRDEQPDTDSASPVVEGRAPRPVVSILVVNWNTRDVTLRCLDALPVRAGVSFETIVVENGSVDGSAEALADRSDIRLIANEQNLGYAAAVNDAYRHSRGEFVLLLNSDVELSRDAFDALVTFLHGHPDAAGVGPLYLNPDRSPQPFHFRLPTFGMLLFNGSSLARRIAPRSSERALRRLRMLDDDFSKPLRVPQPSASCLLLRRSALPEEHVFDERYPIFFNDVQLARWLHTSGRSLWVTPDAVVVHEAHSSGRRLGPAEGRRIYLGSLIRMLAETEPARNVWLYRLLVLVQNLGLALLGRAEALTGRELLRALAGDPGPLPTSPSR